MLKLDIWLFLGFLFMGIGCAIVLVLGSGALVISASVACFFISLALIVYGSIKS